MVKDDVHHMRKMGVARRLENDVPEFDVMYSSGTPVFSKH
jgi:hypothetical protein